MDDDKLKKVIITLFEQSVEKKINDTNKMEEKNDEIKTDFDDYFSNIIDNNNNFNNYDNKNNFGKPDEFGNSFPSTEQKTDEFGNKNESQTLNDQLGNFNKENEIKNNEDEELEKYIPNEELVSYIIKKYKIINEENKKRKQPPLSIYTLSQIQQEYLK